MDKMNEALKEYRRKLDAGEIEKPVVKTPAEKSKAKPMSLRLAINAKCWDCAGESRATTVERPSNDRRTTVERPSRELK